MPGAAERSVTDQELLQEAVEEQGPQEEAGRISKEEGIAFSSVLQLRLEYKRKRILKGVLHWIALSFV